MWVLHVHLVEVVTRYLCWVKVRKDNHRNEVEFPKD